MTHDSEDILPTTPCEAQSPVVGHLPTACKPATFPSSVPSEAFLLPPCYRSMCSLTKQVVYPFFRQVQRLEKGYGFRHWLVPQESRCKTSKHNKDKHKAREAKAFSQGKVNHNLLINEFPEQ